MTEPNNEVLVGIEMFQIMLLGGYCLLGHSVGMLAKQKVPQISHHASLARHGGGIVNIVELPIFPLWRLHDSFESSPTRVTSKLWQIENRYSYQHNSDYNSKNPNHHLLQFLHFADNAIGSYLISFATLSLMSAF